MFVVLRQVKDYIPNTINESIHCAYERAKREDIVNNLLKEDDANIYAIFEVDTGHKNGTEIHVIMSDGVVRIYNKITGKHITDLIARPNQLKRYNIAIDNNILSLAKLHENERLNY